MDPPALFGLEKIAAFGFLYAYAAIPTASTIASVMTIHELLPNAPRDINALLLPAAMKFLECTIIPIVEKNAI